MNEEKKDPQREKLEQMSEKELLVELTYQQQKASRRTFQLMIVGAAVVALLLIVSIIVVPRVVKTLKGADSAITEAEATLTGLQGVVETAGGTIKGIDTMVTGVNDLVEDNSEALTEAISKISTIDFEKLNSSIGDLQAILEPLAKFFNVFN